ncbi:hypothetical protein M569_12084, partial [Genlisea aurea]
TPTSSDHKIAAPTECPPPPRKRRRRVSRNPTSKAASRSLRFQIEPTEVES